MKKVHPHLLHLTTSAGPAALRDMIVLWLAKHLGVSRVIHYRMGRLPTVFARGGMESNLVRRTMRLADAVIILDDSSEKCLKDALPEVNVIRLPNMVEIDDMDRIGHAASPSKSASGAHPRIVFVGHVIPSKGLRELVLACVKLSACPIVLDIIGPVSDEFKQELLALASVTRQGNWITFLGQRDHDETVEHIARADIFVLPSYTEGMPNVVLEAMALGKPILATGVGAIPEMLDIGGEEECGVIVPPREVEPLAAGLERLMADPSLRLELGKKARQRVERLYSVPVACCQLNDAWESLLQSNKSE
jgi:glycosyltransferase involved in cell wall biosynthesis